MSWRGFVTKVALLLMETLWIYALVASLTAAGADSVPVSLVGVGAVVFVSYGIARGLQQTDMELGFVRLWGVGLSLLVFYAIVRIDVFGSLAVWRFGWTDALVADLGEATSGKGAEAVASLLLGIFWIRGLSRGQDSISFESIVKSFAIGVGIISIALLLARVVDAPGSVGVVAVPYIAIGLLTIALTHAGRNQAEGVTSFAGAWALAVGGAVLILSGVALVFVLIDLGALAEALGLAASSVGQVVLWVLWPIGWAASQLVVGIIDFIRWAFGSGEPFTPETPPPLLEGEGDDTRITLPDWLDDVIKGAVGTAAIAIIIGALAHTFRRRRATENRRAVQSTYEEGRLGAELGTMVNSFLGRLRPRMHLGNSLDPVRRLYFELLEAAEKRGIRREPHQTPSELVPEMDAAFQAPTPGRITAAFNDLRYGGLEPAASRIQALRDEWDASRRGAP